MATDKLRLTATDLTALTTCDDEYLLDKGANLYTLGKYEQAVEYYHLATTLGNAQAMANLGYCYLYGRHIKQNLDLALAYFKVAALKKILTQLINWAISTRVISGGFKMMNCRNIIIIKRSALS